MQIGGTLSQRFSCGPEPKLSEIMSAETTSSVMISGEPAPRLRDKPDVSDDTALILAALGRMDLPIHQEPVDPEWGAARLC